MPAPDAVLDLDPLRREVCARFDFGHVVRTEAARMSQSAVLRRLFLFGSEDSAQRYRARDLLQFLAMAGGDLATHVARSAFTYAIVDDDSEVVQVYADLDLFPDLLAWFVFTQQADRAAIAAHLATLTNAEELAVNRIVAGRRFPDLCAASWPGEVPTNRRILRFETCRLIARTRPDLHPALLGFLAGDRDALLGGDPDDILGPIARASEAPPQEVLRPFEQYYDEGTVVAAAEWHLEHGQPEPARELALRIRPLSRVLDRALQVLALLAIDAGGTAEAARLADAIIDPAIADAVAARLAEHGPAAVPTARLMEISERQDAAPELLLSVLRILLARKELALARTVCRNRFRDYADHPALSQIMRSIEPGLPA